MHYSNASSYITKLHTNDSIANRKPLIDLVHDFWRKLPRDFRLWIHAALIFNGLNIYTIVEKLFLFSKKTFKVIWIGIQWLLVGWIFILMFVPYTIFIFYMFTKDGYEPD